MKKYKAKTLLLSAFIAGMVGTFCLSGCGKSSVAPISVTQEQSQTGQAKPVKIAKLSMESAIISPLSDSAGEQKTVSKKIQAIIEPSTAKNASVDWSVEWGEKLNGAVTDYLTVTPDSDGSLSATVTCKQPFTGEIVVVCVTRQGGYVATCTVTYAGQPTDITLAGEVSETDGAYRFGIGNTYEYAVEMSNPFGSVGEKFNNVTVSVTGVGQVIYGAFPDAEQRQMVRRERYNRRIRLAERRVDFGKLCKRETDDKNAVGGGRFLSRYGANGRRENDFL